MTFNRKLKTTSYFPQKSIQSLANPIAVTINKITYMQLLYVDIFIFYVSVYIIMMVHYFSSFYCFVFLTGEIQ